MTYTFTVTITTDYTNLDAPTAEALANEIENHFARLARFGVTDVRAVIHIPVFDHYDPDGRRND